MQDRIVWVGEGSVSGGDCACARAKGIGARAEDAFSALAFCLHARLGVGAKSILLSDESGDALGEALRAHALDQATYGLLQSEPQFSAAQVLTRSQRRFFLTVLLLLTATVAVFPATGGVLLTVLVATGYLANAVFRGLLFWVGADETIGGGTPAVEPQSLPIYTVLVPLYREANVIPQLTASLRRLEYPAAKLDCKLVVEEDDLETCQAARAAAIDGFFEIVVVPKGEPRTKPRACNFALQFARGDFLVIYDAEDQPEPDQLKKALHAFSTGPSELACVQARLNFFNARECWLTRGIMAQTPQAFGMA